MDVAFADANRLYLLRTIPIRNYTRLYRTY
jgi:hypothetical protein